MDLSKAVRVLSSLEFPEFGSFSDADVIAAASFFTVPDKHGLAEAWPHVPLPTASHTNAAAPLDNVQTVLGINIVPVDLPKLPAQERAAIGLLIAFCGLISRPLPPGHDPRFRGSATVTIGTFILEIFKALSYGGSGNYRGDKGRWAVIPLALRLARRALAVETEPAGPMGSESGMITTMASQILILCHRAMDSISKSEDVVARREQRFLAQEAALYMAELGEYIRRRSDRELANLVDDSDHSFNYLTYLLAPLMLMEVRSNPWAGRFYTPKLSHYHPTLIETYGRAAAKAQAEPGRSRPFAPGQLIRGLYLYRHFLDRDFQNRPRPRGSPPAPPPDPDSGDSTEYVPLHPKQRFNQSRFYPVWLRMATNSLIEAGLLRRGAARGLIDALLKYTGPNLLILSVRGAADVDVRELESRYRGLDEWFQTLSAVLGSGTVPLSEFCADWAPHLRYFFDLFLDVPPLALGTRDPSLRAGADHLSNRTLELIVSLCSCPAARSVLLREAERSGVMARIREDHAHIRGLFRVLSKGQTRVPTWTRLPGPLAMSPNPAAESVNSAFNLYSYLLMVLSPSDARAVARLLDTSDVGGIITSMRFELVTRMRMLQTSLQQLVSRMKAIDSPTELIGDYDDVLWAAAGFGRASSLMRLADADAMLWGIVAGNEFPTRAEHVLEMAEAVASLAARWPAPGGARGALVVSALGDLAAALYRMVLRAAADGEKAVGTAGAGKGNGSAADKGKAKGKGGAAAAAAAVSSKKVVRDPVQVLGVLREAQERLREMMRRTLREYLPLAEARDREVWAQ